MPLDALIIAHKVRFFYATCGVFGNSFHNYVFLNNQTVLRTEVWHYLKQSLSLLFANRMLTIYPVENSECPPGSGHGRMFHICFLWLLRQGQYPPIPKWMRCMPTYAHSDAYACVSVWISNHSREKGQAIWSLT
jgi:hypothetical protein